MNKQCRNRLSRNDGFTIAEILIAALLTGFLATAAFGFYISMHNHYVTQQVISDMQQNCRSTLQEITHNLRKAGFKLNGHDPYQISGDTLRIFFSETQPIDSVVYYLKKYRDYEYQELTGRPTSMKFHNLMTKRNGGYPELYSRHIASLQFSEVDSTSVAITVSVRASKRDETFTANNGFRTHSNTEIVNIRNLSL
jgi:hypothetical protein